MTTTTERSLPPDALPVLDKGFLRLVDAMGDDMAVVASARVSYAGGESKGEEKDKKLISFLMKHDHHTPFEHAVFKFHVSCPIFVMRQWIRHRTGSFNEISARYVEVKDEFYVPEVFRAQDTKNKQSSNVSTSIDQAKCRELVERSQRDAYSSYKQLLSLGVAREIARSVLPVSQYTQFYWTLNARNLLHFIHLRADAPAQWEIQQYAEAIAKLFAKRMPWTWAAFLEHGWTGKNAWIDEEKRKLCPQP